MYKSFQTMEELFAYIKEDKEWTGAEAATRNRYPIRFVLFENFADFNKFITDRPEGIYTFSIDDLTTGEYPDLFPTSTELSRSIKEYVSRLPANDYVIFPFSELCRFYDKTEFLALVRTIKGLEPPEDAQAEHTRVYIPVVGMQGKMSRLTDDVQAFIWEYKPPTESGVYRIILAPGSTYGVSGLEERYTVVHNLRHWLQLWKEGESVKKSIVCASESIYRNADHAQPDNAFSYTVCNDAYEFLTRGLGLDFGDIAATEADMPMWEKLAGQIDVGDFDLRDFVNERFDTHNLKDSNSFIKTWLECETDFDRWLLSMYFRKICHGQGYICEVLKRCSNLSTSDLFSAIATGVFEGLATDEYIQCRRQALALAAKQGVKITETAEQRVYAKLKAKLSGSPEDKHRAIMMMTDFTGSDRRLVIEAYGRGLIDYSKLKSIYPDFYYYLGKLGVQLPAACGWVSAYFDDYRKAKVADDVALVAPVLHERNADQSAFYGWFDDFKTVKTLLHDRPDIDVFYWIDGLGVEWVPFISHIVDDHRIENVFLNEVFVARAALPSTTSVNKPKLEELVPEGGKLEKIGDLDSFAHQNTCSYPLYLIEEMRIVKEAITKVLQAYNGKKIAFVSDHGITYMAQYGKGLNIAGVESEHEGRVAHKTSGKAGQDSKYVILEDGKTLCALTEDSLTTKTAKNHGAHGGATPEEVLVPIIIVSNHKNASAYSAWLVNDEIDGTNPVLRLKIKGLLSVDVPELEYKGVRYNLNKETAEVFASERLYLVDTATKVTLHIGDFKRTFNIKISTGAEENDLFGNL